MTPPHADELRMFKRSRVRKKKSIIIATGDDNVGGDGIAFAKRGGRVKDENKCGDVS